MAKEVSLNFKAEEELANMLGRASVLTDKHKSEIIRTCLLLSINTVVANPGLCGSVQLEHFSSNNSLES